MKIYICANQLRMVGKVWEIRHQLRMLIKQHGDRNVQLVDVLDYAIK